MPTAAPRTPGARALLGALLGLFIFLGGGHIYSPDGAVMFNMTRAFAEGRLSYPVAGNETLPGFPVPGEPRYYSKYGLGMSLTGLAPYLASRALLPLTTDAERGVFATPASLEGPISWGGPPTTRRDKRAFRRLWYDVHRANFEYALGAWLFTWISAVSTACVAVLLVRIARRVGAGPRAALWTGLALTLGSPLLHYAREGWSEPLATACLIGAVERILAWRQSPAPRALLAAGLAIGWMLLTKLALAPLLLPLGLLLTWRTPPRRLPRAAALIAAGGLGPGALFAGYNLARFGDPLSTGYGEELSRWTTPWAEGLAGLLISPGRGLLLFCPLVFGALAALPEFRRRAPALAAAGPLSLALLLALYCRWWAWEGGWCWGPRFLLPALPLLLLPLSSFFEGEVPGWRAWVCRVSLGLAALSSALSILVNPHDYYQWMKRWMLENPQLWTGEHWFSALRWDWAYSPLIDWWGFPVKETLLLGEAMALPGVVLGLLLAALALLLVSAVRLRRALLLMSPRRGAP